MKDTLQTIVKTIDKCTDNSIELINKVDSFYNSAWDKLIIVGSVSFAVIGVLVPFIIQWYQKKTLKISEELLKKEIEHQALKIKEDMLGEIEKTLEERVGIFENKIVELNASTTAKTFHLQGNGQLEGNFFLGALEDYIIAAQNYIVCGEYANLQTVLSIIHDNCIPRLTQEEINDLKITSDCDLELLLNNLTAKDDKGTFRQIIRNIRFTVSKLPKSTQR